jgi:hypothetical protein
VTAAVDMAGLTQDTRDAWYALQQAAMDQLGFDLQPRSARRTCAQQAEQWAIGRSGPNDTRKQTTHAQGCRSWHVTGHAIDFFVFVNGVKSTMSADYTTAGQLAESMGWIWGGRFPGFGPNGDEGHVEWHPGLTTADVCPDPSSCVDVAATEDTGPVEASVFGGLGWQGALAIVGVLGLAVGGGVVLARRRLPAARERHALAADLEDLLGRHVVCDELVVARGDVLVVRVRGQAVEGHEDTQDDRAPAEGACCSLGVERGRAARVDAAAGHRRQVHARRLLRVHPRVPDAQAVTTDAGPELRRRAVVEPHVLAARPRRHAHGPEVREVLEVHTLRLVPLLGLVGAQLREALLPSARASRRVELLLHVRERLGIAFEKPRLEVLPPHPADAPRALGPGEFHSRDQRRDLAWRRARHQRRGFSKTNASSFTCCVTRASVA